MLASEPWRIIEIDPDVVAIASNPAWLTYLSSSPTDAIELSTGDGRIVEVLMTSLRYASPREVEQAWVEEVQRRIERLERGETVAVEWSEAKRRLREKHGVQ